MADIIRGSIVVTEKAILANVDLSKRSLTKTSQRHARHHQVKRICKATPNQPGAWPPYKKKRKTKTASYNLDHLVTHDRIMMLKLTKLRKAAVKNTRCKPLSLA